MIVHRLGARTTVASLASVACAALSLPLLAAPAEAEDSAITVQDLTSGVTAEQLAQELAGPGVEVSAVHYTGAEQASGLFDGGAAPVGFADGVVLTSGAASDVTGPNEDDATSVTNGVAGDADLDELSGYPTYDAAVLEFDFVPNGSHIQFQYTFASEEYNEFVFSPFNDVFGFFVNGQNCALTPGGAAVSINTINNGHDNDGVQAQNPHLYRNNDLDNGGGEIATEMDGLTVVMTCAASVQAGAVNHMRLAIADASDAILDSAVFIKAESLTTMTCAEDGLDSIEGKVASGTVHGVEPGVDKAGTNLGVPGLGSFVHDVNCNLIVPTEDVVDDLVVTSRSSLDALGDAGNDAVAATKDEVASTDAETKAVIATAQEEAAATREQAVEGITSAVQGLIASAVAALSGFRR